MKTDKTILTWDYPFLATFFIAYLFVFNEWIFAITKPSYLNFLSFAQQLKIYLTVSALLTGVCFLSLLPLVLLGRISPIKRYKVMMIRLGCLLPAGIGATLILILIDNFTYTVFKFGIVLTEGWLRAMYGLGFSLTVVLCYRYVLNSLMNHEQRVRNPGHKSIRLTSLLSIVILLSLAILIFPDRDRVPPVLDSDTGTAASLPHIVIITADGVDANHASVYGYSRETTPRMQELAASSLVAENAFANFHHTTGSIVSMYTGKYPAQTRFYHAPPDVLEGVDSYEHLPGLLRSLGYRTVQVTIPLFLEAGRVNLLNGFDDVKMSNAVYSKYLNLFLKWLPSSEALFLDETFKRVVDRVRHVFFINTMTNPYLMVTKMSSLIVDAERWAVLRQEMQSAEKPTFIHIHLMVTHGKRFNPLEQRFSAGRSIEDQAPWEDDFYDDAILDFDRNLGEFVDYLREIELLDKTVLIIGSDHAQQWNLAQRVPLIIRFPHGENAGVIQANVQNIDIAPTILDYIDLNQPDWMHGHSLIAGELKQRPILAVASVYEEPNSKTGNAVRLNASGLPFETYNVTLIYCQRWFDADLVRQSWTSGYVEGSTAACPPEEILSSAQVSEAIVEHLNEHGYDDFTIGELPP